MGINEIFNSKLNTRKKSKEEIIKVIKEINNFLDANELVATKEICEVSDDFAIVLKEKDDSEDESSKKIIKKLVTRNYQLIESVIEEITDMAIEVLSGEEVSSPLYF